MQAATITRSIHQGVILAALITRCFVLPISFHRPASSSFAPPRATPAFALANSSRGVIYEAGGMVGWWWGGAEEEEEEEE